MMSVKIQGEGILKVKKAMHVPILHFPGRGLEGWGFKGWERAFEPNYPPQEVCYFSGTAHFKEHLFVISIFFIV